MRDLNYQLKKLCLQHKEDSYRTQSDRGKQLHLIANQLYELGFRQMAVTSLKEKHVVALVNRWHDEGISDGSIKNRMSALRWWAGKVNRPVIAKDNGHYGIGQRQYVTNTDKSSALSADQLMKVSDPHVRCSLLLQEAFGLRREEAIKFSPSVAIKSNQLELKGSWTKGGKPRIIPIETAQQRAVLERVKTLVGNAALIPANRNFRKQLHVYEYQTAKAGLTKMHGLRHAYAQRRYYDLTGRHCPSAGGLSKKNLSPQQKAQDYAVRMRISKELGHERESITTVYLGR